MKLSITSGALEDLEAWSTTNPKVLSKIIRLIAETTRTPRTGTGKPERLKHLGGEVWSRRITEKDRLVYDIQSDVVTIIACRFHYDDHQPGPSAITTSQSRVFSSPDVAQAQRRSPPGLIDSRRGGRAGIRLLRQRPRRID